MTDLGYRCSLLCNLLEGRTNYEVYGKSKHKELRVEFKRADELLIERFEEWLRGRGYAEKTVEHYVRYLGTIFRKVGVTTREEKVREAFWFSPYLTRKNYIRAFHRFRDFLASCFSPKGRW